MLQFCANLSLLFTEVPLPDRFAAAQRAGFSAVEIQFPYALPAKQIQSILEQQQLKLVLFNVAADDLMQGGEGLACVPKKRDAFKYAIEQAVGYADYLHPYAINVLAGRCFEPQKTPYYWDTFQENLSFATEAFASIGVKTVFEAINTHDMPHFLIHSGTQLLAILQQLNQPTLAIQYDIYHAHRMAEDFNLFIQQAIEKIGHIQFADSPGRGQPGTGEIDFAHLFSTLEASVYTGWVGAEYNPQGLTENSLTWLPQ
jgi:hydroxypyruvate isomerase